MCLFHADSGCFPTGLAGLMLSMFLISALGLWYGGKLLADSTEEAIAGPFVLPRVLMCEWGYQLLEGVLPSPR